MIASRGHLDGELFVSWLLGWARHVLLRLATAPDGVLQVTWTGVCSDGVHKLK